MGRKRRFPLWILPLAGIILGWASAYINLHGMVVPWHFVGNPSEKIVRIVGFVDGNHLFVQTESGAFYSIQYLSYLNGQKDLPHPVDWTKEDVSNPQPDPAENWTAPRFIPLPLLVKVQQMYDTQFPRIEGRFLVKFALSEDGNLWMWNYSIGSLSGLLYFFFPVFGLVAGIALALTIIAFRFIREKLRS